MFFCGGGGGEADVTYHIWPLSMFQHASQIQGRRSHFNVCSFFKGSGLRPRRWTRSQKQTRAYSLPGSIDTRVTGLIPTGHIRTKKVLMVLKTRWLNASTRLHIFIYLHCEEVEFRAMPGLKTKMIIIYIQTTWRHHPGWGVGLGLGGIWSCEGLQKSVEKYENDRD